MAYPLEVGELDDYPVKVGSMLFTLVDPHRGFERAYNRWYERDHYISGCLVGPWNFAGSRWVATRELKDLRWGTRAVADPIDAGSYLAIYWIELGHHEDWDAWALPQVRWLYANGRGFAERSHVHTATFDRVGAHYRDPDPVPVELALDHGYPGLVAVFFDARRGRATELLDALGAGPLPQLLAGSTLELAASWVPRPEFRNSRDSAPMALGSPGGGEQRLVQLFFCAGDVRAELDRLHAYSERVAADGLAELALAAPFWRTELGTHRYTDELW